MSKKSVAMGKACRKNEDVSSTKLGHDLGAAKIFFLRRGTYSFTVDGVFICMIY